MALFHFVIDNFTDALSRPPSWQPLVSALIQ